MGQLLTPRATALLGKDISEQHSPSVKHLCKAVRIHCQMMSFPPDDSEQQGHKNGNMRLY